MRFLLERIASPLQYESFATLKVAVRANVQRLVDSHRIHSRGGVQDILSFGLPSVVEIGRASVSQQQDYAASIEQVIRRFEPRLRNPQVELVPSDSESRAPYLLVAAELVLADSAEEFRFPLEIDRD